MARCGERHTPSIQGGVNRTQGEDLGMRPARFRKPWPSSGEMTCNQR